MAIIIVSVLVYLVLWFFVAQVFFNIVQMKGHYVNEQFYNCQYFWWTFLTGFIGILMIIALPDRKDVNKTSAAKDDELPPI